MIAFLNGKLEESLPTRVVLSVQGVGYEVFIPMSTFDRLPGLGAEVRLWTHMHVREDALQLYGFYTQAELELFRLLIHRVTGIGPKLGLSVLSGMSVDQFKMAVVEENTSALSKISGLGKKTAERIVLELKDKVGVAEAWKAAASAGEGGSSSLTDAILALISLGFKQTEAQRAVEAVRKTAGEESVSTDQLVRQALQRLS